MLLAFLHEFKRRAWLAWPLAAGNLAAVWWGYTDYYDVQLAETDAALRPFVADSPNAVLLFAVALILFPLGIRSATLDLFAWAANIKVGIWTVFVLLYYYDEFFAEDFALRWTLLVLHVGMVAQAFVLALDLRRHRLAWISFGAVAAWALVGDALDYAGPHLHPILRGGPDHDVVALVTVGLSVATLGVAWALFRPDQARPPWSRPRASQAS